MGSNQISDKSFSAAVRAQLPVPDTYRYSNSESPISYTSYDSYEKFNRIEEGEWDIFKDCEKEELESKKLGPPPRPQFNQKTTRPNANDGIETILDEPGRNKRPEKILIFIRGAPGSGKSFLANQILEHEKKFGTKRIKFCTPNKYYAKQSFVRDEAEKYINNLHAEVMDLLREGFYSFMIVEMEGDKLDVLKKLAEVGKECGYETYGIDVNQEYDVCKKYVKHSRVNSDIETIAKQIVENKMPWLVTILDPIELVDPGWKARQPKPKPKSPSPPRKYRRPGRRRRNSDSDDSRDEDACFVCYG